jgi:thioester reductase-like protein
MHYFVTGATGFIGRRLVKRLLARAAARCIS